MSGRLGLAAGLCEEQAWLAADCLEHEAGVEAKLAVAGQVGCAHALAADATLGGAGCRAGETAAAAAAEIAVSQIGFGVHI
jgi:hypothetical protein